MNIEYFFDKIEMVAMFKGNLIGTVSQLKLQMRQEGKPIFVMGSAPTPYNVNKEVWAGSIIFSTFRTNEHQTDDIEIICRDRETKKVQRIKGSILMESADKLPLVRPFEMNTFLARVPGEWNDEA